MLTFAVVSELLALDLSPLMHPVRINEKVDIVKGLD